MPDDDDDDDLLPRRSSLEWTPRCQRGEHEFESRTGRWGVGGDG